MSYKAGICKIGLCVLLALGCNLSIEGHFLPDNILPYIFLVLNSFVVFRISWDRLLEWLKSSKVKLTAAFVLLFCVLMQSVILRIYLNNGIVVFIKAGIKVMIAGVAAAVILLLALFTAIERKKNVGIPFISFGLLGIIYFYFIRRITDGFSIYPLLVFVLIYLVKTNLEDVKKSESILTGIGAVFLALFETLGYLAVTYWDYYGGLLKWLGLAIIGTAVWTFIFYYVLRAIFIMLDSISCDRNPEKKNIRQICAVSAAMLGVRFLYWLNWFPALLSKDTYVQIQQALGNEPYSNHHPWLHTMIIKFFMGIGRFVFGSNQAGVALTAFASFVISSILLLIVLNYYKNRVMSGVWWFAALIFIIEPIHCVYSITIWKDVLFAYALVAFCFILMVMEAHIKQQETIKPYMWVLYVLISFVFCFSRTNGLYAWLFTLPFLLWHYRKKLKPWIVSTLVCILLIIGYKGWLLPHFHVTEPDAVEALSVPLQQIAFTVKNGGDFSQYDTDVINNIVDMESMGENYSAHISDTVKNLIRDYGSQEYIIQNKLEFIKMYISVGLKNPTDYIVAFLNQSRGYWYQKMSNYIYFSEGVHRFAAELDIYRQPLLPDSLSTAADNMMNRYCDIWHTLWSLALSTYVILILFVYSLVRKRPAFYFLPVIGVFITLVIATPVNDEFRYAYGIYLALPLFVMNTCVPRDMED